MFLVHPHTRMSSSPSHALAFGLDVEPPSQEKRGFHQGWAIHDGEMRATKRRKSGVQFAVGEEEEEVEVAEAQALKRRGSKRSLSAAVCEDEEFFLAERLTLQDRNDDDEDEYDNVIECLRKRNRRELAETALDEEASPGGESSGEGDGEFNADYLSINSLLRDLHCAQQRRRNQASSSSQGMAMAAAGHGSSQESEMEVGQELSSTPLVVLLRDLPSTRRHEYEYRCRLERERAQQDGCNHCHGESEGEADALMDIGGSPTARFRPFLMSFRSESQKEDEMA